MAHRVKMVDGNRGLMCIDSLEVIAAHSSKTFIVGKRVICHFYLFLPWLLLLRLRRSGALEKAGLLAFCASAT